MIRRCESPRWRVYAFGSNPPYGLLDTGKQTPAIAEWRDASIVVTGEIAGQPPLLWVARSYTIPAKIAASFLHPSAFK